MDEPVKMVDVCEGGCEGIRVIFLYMKQWEL
jgi:hypothetical protein